MIRSHFISSIATAAVLGLATPVLAQTTTQAPSATSSKPLCSTLGHPNAGKLADKSTGMAKENSQSAVHMDCIPDSEAASASTGSVSGTASGTTGSASSSPSATGSTAGSTSSVTGSSSDVSSSVTGSTSTVSPTIDLRGRSSVTIDNTTSTGDQSATSSATTTTGNQSSTAKQPKK